MATFLFIYGLTFLKHEILLLSSGPDTVKYVGVDFRLTISGGPRYHGWSHWAERIMPLIKSKEGSSSLWLTSVTLDPCCIYLICIWRRCIVVMDFDCYTGDRGLIPTQLTMIHKLRNLRPGSTHVLWGKLGSQSKVLTGHWIT